MFWLISILSILSIAISINSKNNILATIKWEQTADKIAKIMDYCPIDFACPISSLSLLIYIPYIYSRRREPKSTETKQTITILSNIYILWLYIPLPKTLWL